MTDELKNPNQQVGGAQAAPAPVGGTDVTPSAVGGATMTPEQIAAATGGRVLSDEEVGKTTTVPATVEKPNDTSLFKEIRMIREASMALSNNAPAKTLQILSAYDKAFPNGAMRQERDGLRVLALCALNRNTQADREKARFLKKSPDSPMARRIKASCQSEEKSE